MDEEDKKQFIKDVMNMRDSLSKPKDKDLINSFQKDIISAFQESPDFHDIVDKKFDIDEYMDICKQGDLDPLEVFESFFQIVGSAGVIENKGQSFDFSVAPKIFDELKEKFIKHKEANDIKNF